MYQDYEKISRRTRPYMLEEEGVVKELRGDKAVVLTERKEQCRQCIAKGACDMLGGGKQVLAEVRNPLGAQVEDVVRIGVPEGTVTRASLVAYMVPAVGTVAGAGLGYYIAQIWLLNQDVWTLIGSLGGLAFALVSVRLLSNFLGKRPEYRPEIIRIIPPEAIHCRDEKTEKGSS